MREFLPPHCLRHRSVTRRRGTVVFWLLLTCFCKCNRIVRDLKNNSLL
jgi:hypothetical protein